MAESTTSIAVHDAKAWTRKHESTFVRFHKSTWGCNREELPVSPLAWHCVLPKNTYSYPLLLALRLRFDFLAWREY